MRGSTFIREDKSIPKRFIYSLDFVLAKTIGYKCGTVIQEFLKDDFQTSPVQSWIVSIFEHTCHRIKVGRLGDVGLSMLSKSFSMMSSKHPA